MASITSDLDRAESIRLKFGAEFERQRFELIKRMEAGVFRTPSQVQRYHELVGFARAWPDSPRVLRLSRRITKNFDRRQDLRRFRKRLKGTGIAGTDIPFSFYLPTAKWLARHWPQQLDMDWENFEEHDRLDELLKHMAVFAEQQGLESYDFNGIERIQKMRGSNNNADGTFLISLFELLPVAQRIKEHFYDNLSLPLVLHPGPKTPSRTKAELHVSEIHYQDRSLGSATINLKQVAKQPLTFSRVTGTQARGLIALARGAMVSRFRDIDPIAYADPHDVRVVDCGQGIQIVLYGVVPERRFLLECEYGHLILKNGIPVGYGSAWSLYGTCLLNFNIFPTFRGGQGVLLYAKTFAAFHQLFSADTFVVEPYQLGEENEEAIQSGAWWFYNKLGYKPYDREASRLAKSENEKRRTRTNYRSSPSALRRLAQAPMFLHLGCRRKDVLGLVDLEACGLAVTDYLSRQRGSDRARAEVDCAKTVCSWLDIDQRKLSSDQRLWLRRWSPLIVSLGSVPGWSQNDKAALTAVLLAKGGREQSRYVHLFDRHQHLRESLLKLSRRGLQKLE
ncbi:MAG: hypothetical protein E2O37_05315 [Proteobacteria bacterium]|nr:MAG: hypothetical protein E2O37_05315 [Pseudomonadota bacterium]TDJ69657.1 MAG: hypothetical protein E2O38_13110 [Pseudomonadota bacterium]